MRGSSTRFRALEDLVDVMSRGPETSRRCGTHTTSVRPGPCSRDVDTSLADEAARQARRSVAGLASAGRLRSKTSSTPSPRRPAKMGARSVVAEILKRVRLRRWPSPPTPPRRLPWHDHHSVGADDNTATREMAGTVCFSKRNLLSVIPALNSSIPVVTPPGRLTLSAKPAPMRSGPRTTSGIVGFA